MKYFLTKNAKNLRKNSTESEKKLWKYLSRKQLKGIKFRRQQPIGRFIVDFVCFEKKSLLNWTVGNMIYPRMKIKEGMTGY